MIRSVFFAPNGKLSTDLEPEQWAEALTNPQGLLWVDFQNTPPESDEPLFRQVFKFHPLAIDDALQETHVPKIDDWGEYLYIVLQSLSFDNPHSNSSEGRLPHVEGVELDLFLGPNYVISHHDQPIDAVDRVWKSIQRDERHLRSGADHLLYRLVDEVVTNYMPMVDALDNAIDDVESELFNNAGPHILERIFALKRAVLALRRTLGPEREVLNRLARDDYAVIDERDRVYFRDVYDHLVRLVDITEGIRDLVAGVLDTYLSVINNRMNDIMKTLTIITTLFMPLSFLTGFFGMNFFAADPPFTAWTRPLVFIASLAVMVITPVVMSFWMRRRHWM